MCRTDLPRGGPQIGILIWTRLVVPFVLILCACTPQPRQCASPGVHCAGLVTDFGSVDEGISQQAWLGLQDAQALGLVERIDVVETVDTRDREANIKAFAEDGYDFIVTVGAGTSDETLSAAGEYPNLRFIGVQQSHEAPSANLVALAFHEEQSGFLAGALAGLLTQTGYVAAVCEASFIDSMRRYCDGFDAGAEYVDPAVRAEVAYRSGSSELLFHDTEWGRATAMQFLDLGADVLFAVGEETADAAMIEAARRGALVIGAETDIYEHLPEVRARLVTSAISDVRSGIVNLLQLARQGSIPNGVFFGEVGLASFHEMEGRIASQTLAEIQRISDGLESGAIRLDVPFEAP
jgi:basic membrane protein A